MVDTFMEIRSMHVMLEEWFTMGMRHTGIWALILLIIPLWVSGGEVQFRETSVESDLPEAFAAMWQPGDFLYADGKFLALIGGTSRMLQSSLNYPAADAKGTILAFAPAEEGVTADLIAGAPYVRIRDRRVFIKYASFQKTGGGGPEEPLIVEAKGLFVPEGGGKAAVRTEYRFHPGEGKVGIVSTITNTGRAPLEDLEYDVTFLANHVYGFSPFHPEKHPNLHFRVYPKKGHVIGWVDRNPIADEEIRPGTLEPGASFTVAYALFVRTDGEELLGSLYTDAGVSFEKAHIFLEEETPGLTEVVVRDIVSRTVFFRNFLEEPRLVEVPLPEGLYEVTAHFFPALTEELLVVVADEENTCVLQEPASGFLRVKITDSHGEYVPGKVTFIGLDPTKSPYFEPENPIETGKRWETFKNSCFPEEGGTVVRLPVGTYLVCASRGPEYTRDHRVIEILKDKTYEMTLRIDRIVETQSLLSIDPHMHTVYSDGTVTIPERVRSLVAEGVDVAVATDHNYVNDYGPALKALGLDRYLNVLVGTEVTTGGVIHYNTYPMRLRADEPNNGAINPHQEEASSLFRASRAKDPEALIQVNHPRSGSIGYFDNTELDPEDAASARDSLDLNFDLLEVINGPSFSESNQKAVADWLHLLNKGFIFPIVGSSDSHTIDGGEPGYSRTYVFYTEEKGKGLNTRALLDALKKGRAFVSNGPVVELRVNSAYGPGDSCTARDGKTDIRIRVEGAPWVSVHEVRLILNGERKLVFPVGPSGEELQKFDQSLSLDLDEDTSIAVEVMGQKSLFPVHQGRARGGLPENAVLPYALTNPVFVDVDGNGRFDPPWPHEISRLSLEKSPTPADHTGFGSNSPLEKESPR